MAKAAAQRRQSGNQTVPTKRSVAAFLKTVENPGRREDAEQLVKLFEKWTGYKPKMWGPSIIGYGRHEYAYESGRTGEMLAAGFSPRKANMTLYVGAQFPEKEALLAKLGKHKTSVACLYIGRLSSVDLKVLEKITKGSMKATKAKHKVYPE